MRYGERGDTQVKVADGTKLPLKVEVKYLGCYLNQKTDGGKELNRIIMECMTILKGLICSGDMETVQSDREQMCTTP